VSLEQTLKSFRVAFFVCLHEPLVFALGFESLDFAIL
jgi:hypothetical protein